MPNDIYAVGEINAPGESALVNWLRGVMKEPEHAESYAAHMIGSLDGGSAQYCALSVELQGHKSRTGNPETYTFGPTEYDLITYDEFGNRVGGEVA
jgi:hypothetical protein